MQTASTHPSPFDASKALALFQVVELLVESLQVHFGQHIIIELPEPALSYERLARRAKTLSESVPEVREALDEFLGLFPSLYGIGEWLDLWDQVWDDHGKSYQVIANLRRAASSHYVSCGVDALTGLSSGDEWLLEKAAMVIDEHRRLKGREVAKLFGRKANAEADKMGPSKTQQDSDSRPDSARAISDETARNPHTLTLVRGLLSRMWDILSIHFSGYLLMESDAANRTYLQLKNWVQTLDVTDTALKESLATFLSAYPNLYECGDEVDWDYADQYIKPLKARLSEAMAASSATADAQIPVEWTELLAAVDKVIAAFRRYKQESDVRFLERTRDAAAKYAGDFQSLFAARTPAASAVVLSPEDEQELSRQRFKSRLPIKITGQTEGRAQNIVLVDGKEVYLGDAEFLLFLRLVLTLFETPDGYVPGAVLQMAQDDASRTGAANAIEQYVGRLRERFRGRLNGLPPAQFIEVSHGRYRLSTLRRLVSWDRPALSDHPQSAIKMLASRLFALENI